MTRVLAWAFGGMLAAALLGGGGYAYWTLSLRQRKTAQRLDQSQASLAKSEQSLATLQDAHQQLAKEYDTLKDHWKATDEQLQQATKESVRLTTQLAALSAERTGLQRQLDETNVQQVRLRGQAETMERQLASSKAERQALEAALGEAAARAVSPAELQQLAQAIAQQQEERAQLRGHLEQLSQAYEQLARAGSPARKVEIAVGQPSSPARASPDETRSARLYRDLGDAYLATNRYTEAARMFEQSLTLKEDPEVHSRLAFLYGRLLHDPVQAAKHAALASDQDEVTAGLAAASRADGLPRKSSRLVWRWLTQ